MTLRPQEFGQRTTGVDYLKRRGIVDQDGSPPLARSGLEVEVDIVIRFTSARAEVNR